MFNKKGFTLIELMIVIAIIGILAAIAIPNFIAYRDKSYCASAEQDAKSILSALSCYFSEPTNYDCTSLTTLENDTTCTVTLTGDNSGALSQAGSGSDAVWTIVVTEATGRCPRGDYFETFMGTSTVPGWR